MIHDIPSKHGSGDGEGKPTPASRAMKPRSQVTSTARSAAKRQAGAVATASRVFPASRPATRGLPGAGSLQAEPPDGPRAETGQEDRQRPRADYPGASLMRPTATVKATAATNDERQRPAAAHNTHAILATLGYVRPEKQTVEDQRRCAATVAKRLNNTRRTWTTLEYRPSPRLNRL